MTQNENQQNKTDTTKRMINMEYIKKNIGQLSAHPSDDTFQ